jgi:hypothetical protein
MDQETVGALLGGKTDRRLTEVHGCREPGDLSRVANLEAVQRLRGVSDFFGDTEIVVEIADQGV